ncbi:MAG: glycine--tRNA ligase subunit beta [Candidatus Eisenbacteria bacterium]|nr:glycine--tRNA ligase subunit beta [Candidatus Eisenbacteria bacterium]
MKRDLLIEIGAEEIPASYVPPACEALAEALPARLREMRLAHGRVDSFATPRRLALRIADLDSLQPDAEREVTGPPKKIAFDADGKPTKAALGFAKTQGIPIEALRIAATEKGEYLAATVVDRGKPVAELLGPLVREVVATLPFPRTMRWEPSGFLFARPIQWIVALFGDEVIPLSIAGVTSGRESRGHRVLHPAPVPIAEPRAYEDALRRAGVLVSPDERRRAIEKEIERALAGGEGRVLRDAELLETVNYLVEYPRALLGRFDPRMLRLPNQVVVTAMRAHQRYFAVVDESGGLLPFFVAIANGIAENEGGIRAGMERVLAARLADAEFYWNEDRAVPLEERVDGLRRMVWQEGMGSLLEKTERIEKIAAALAAESAPDARGAAARAARLSKADLTTEMIRDGKEFTALQGYMGMEYARSAGEPDEVARAIFEQYLPRFSGDALPETIPGALLSLADRVDTLLGCLGAGLVPTGSQDPYGLRRHALAILRILAEKKVSVPLGRLLAIGAEAYGERLPEPEKTIGEALRFFRGRLRNLLVEKGLPYDIVEAVLDVGLDDPADLERRALAIRDFRERESFERLVVGFKRVVNILKGSDSAGAVDPSLLGEPEEKELHRAAEEAAGRLERALVSADYRAAMEHLLALRDPIDRFFDKVLVMDKEERIRENRLALLAEIARAFRRLADLSKVVLEGERE